MDPIAYYLNANWSQGVPPPMNENPANHSVPARIRALAKVLKHANSQDPNVETLVERCWMPVALLLMEKTSKECLKLPETQRSKDEKNEITLVFPIKRSKNNQRPPKSLTLTFFCEKALARDSRFFDGLFLPQGCER